PNTRIGLERVAWASTLARACAGRPRASEYACPCHPKIVCGLLKEAFEPVSCLREAGFFFFGCLHHFIAGEFGLGGADCAAFWAGDYQDDIAEAGAGMAIRY